MAASPAGALLTAGHTRTHTHTHTHTHTNTHTPSRTPLTPHTTRAEIARRQQCVCHTVALCIGGNGDRRLSEVSSRPSLSRPVSLISWPVWCVYHSNLPIYIVLSVCRVCVCVCVCVYVSGCVCVCAGDVRLGHNPGLSTHTHTRTETCRNTLQPPCRFVTFSFSPSQTVAH